MQKEILLEILDQNQSNCAFTFKDINEENINFRLNENTASVGFIYRHIGETTNTLGRFLGMETDVMDTTMGQLDNGQRYDLEMSHKLMEQGYKMLAALIKNLPDEDWLEEVEASFFGKISRIRLFSIVLFHNSHHCGQIASAIVKGKAY
ncbi:MAG: DinB family protein [Bacteroidota bacterium]